MPSPVNRIPLSGAEFLEFTRMSEHQGHGIDCLEPTKKALAAFPF